MIYDLSGHTGFLESNPFVESNPFYGLNRGERRVEGGGVAVEVGV